MSRCRRCASEQLPNTLFCDSCGEELKRNSTGNTRSLFCRLADSGQLFILPDHDDMIVGRSNASTGAVADIDLGRVGGKEAGVSRVHARLTRKGDDLYLEDLGSMNGTFINDIRLPSGKPALLQPSDTIRFGLLRVMFEVSSS